MANIDRPSGARSTGKTLTGGSCLPANPYEVDVDNGTAIFPGDGMILENDGNVAPYTGTAGGNLIGFCVGIKDDYSDLERRYLPASTVGTVLINDDPDTIFTMQEDDVDGSALAQTNVGNNCDILATAGATTGGGMSRHEIDRSTATASAAQLRLIRIIPSADNAYGDFAEWEFVINEHSYKSTSGV